MKKLINVSGLGLITLLLLIGCKKTDSYSSENLSDYLNLEVGKYITYRLDSLRYINFGQKDTTVFYEAKDVVESAITDNLGRPGYRIVRYLRDTSSTSEFDWHPVATIEVIPTRETIEWVENNFRFQKLKLPVKEGFNWKGNAYIDLIALDPTDLNWDYRYYDDWDYTYANVGSPFIGWNNVVIDNTLTVNQRDEILGDPSDPNVYSERNYSQEVYGKGVGLVYREFLHWVYQPPKNSDPGYTDGYGIKMTIIDHN